MQMLAVVTDGCRGLKGGALASTLHGYMKHGDPYIRDMISRILDAVNRPVTTMLQRWIYEGELEDPDGEFFVADDATAPIENMWAKKYSIRESMLPSFMQRELCDKILMIGKSINFIRKVCEISDPLLANTPELHSYTGFALHDNRVLRPIVEEVYQVVSKRLLEIFFQKYKFVEHLHAIRRYLLLGQGDFIRHLMDVLHEDLARPASSLFLHNLTSILETAVRATNAQYDSQDMLARLDVQLFEMSPGDVGWDVFTLIYRSDGPISTVVTPSATKQYLKIFNFLWRAKRMEFVLSQVWSKQMTFSRSLSQVKEMQGALKLSETMHAAMQHFVNQIQYYFVFEVLECSWHDLTKAVSEAKDLDQVIAAHSRFLTDVTTRALLGPESKAMLSQLRSIFDVVVSYKTAQESLYESGTEELERRDRDESKAYEQSLAGQWGVTDPTTSAQHARTSKFLSDTLPEAVAQLENLMARFQEMVGRFLTMLMMHEDPNLRFLSFRVDFNEFYRRKIPEYSTVLSPFQQRQRKQRGEVGRSGLAQPSFNG